jgi:predicted dehydrogenase
MDKVAPIRVGVIGTGVMGGHHTRVAAALPGCQLIGIYDANTACAELVARQFGVMTFASLPALCDAVDAVIVASPTVTHADIGAQCLRAGCHVLLEKPIAATIAEAEALVAISAKTDRILMVGHLERFNPAVTTALSILARNELFAIDLQRLSTAPGRDRSADIIFDLMIHDIDLAMAFSGSTVISVHAMGHHVRCDFIDHVTALLRFANGTTATLTASAVSQERVRKGRLFTKNAQLTVDFASREVWVHRHGKSSIAMSDGQYYQASQVEQIIVPPREPLMIEQEHFLQAIRSGVQPLTHAEVGLQALRLAQAIQDDVNAQLVEHV